MFTPVEGLGFVSVHTADLARARAFYVDRLICPVLHEDDDEIFVDLAGTPLCIHHDRDGSCGRPPGGPTGLYLQVADIQRTAADLRAVQVPSEPDGERFLEVRDPDGNLFVFWQPRVAWPPKTS